MLVAHLRDFGTCLRHILAHTFGTWLMHILMVMVHGLKHMMDVLAHD
jgi:hypothetical protein